MAETKNLLVTLEALKSVYDYQESTIKAGTKETAELHLGFYIDENGDLCQKED